MKLKKAGGLCAAALFLSLVISAPGCGGAPQGDGGAGGSAGSGGVAGAGGTAGTGGGAGTGGAAGSGGSPGSGGTAGSGGAAGAGGTGGTGGTSGTGGTGGFPVTISLTDLPPTDDDGDYTLQWSVSGLASAPWTIHEDDNASFTSPSAITSHDSSAPYTHSIAGRAPGHYCYRVGASPSGPFSNATCTTVELPTRQLTLINSMSSSLNIHDIVQIKLASTRPGLATREDVLTDDPARCLSLPGDSVPPGESVTIDLSVPDYFVYVGIGIWDLDNVFCQLGFNWFKRTYFTDIDFNTYYVWTDVEVHDHESGNWEWTISGSYLNGTLVVTPTGSSAIPFKVTDDNPIP